ncbi:MAG: hypothetical protein ACE366_23670 [Bradymonadia bacterium]
MGLFGPIATSKGVDVPWLKRSSLCVSLLCLALGGLSGCEIDKQDIDTWPQVDNGAARLGAYVADAERPIGLRIRAAKHLMSMGELDQLMTSVEATPAPARDTLVSKMGDLVAQCLVSLEAVDTQNGGKVNDCDTPQRDRGKAMNLGYLLLEHIKDGKEQAALVDALFKASMTGLTADIPELAGKVDDIILACSIKAPEKTVPMLLETLKGSESPQAGARVSNLLLQMRDDAVSAQLAAALLDWVKPRYKTLLQSPEVRDALTATRNPTVMRFMLDAIRDPDLDWDARQEIFVRSLKLLQNADAEAATEALHAFIALVDHTSLNELRWLSLSVLWAKDPAAHLKPMMDALPAAADAWHSEKGRVKWRISEFCKVKVGKKGMDQGVLLPMFETLLDHTNPIVRMFGVTCIHQLDPVGAADRLAGLIEDPAVLLNWTEEGDSTIGDEVSAISGG